MTMLVWEDDLMGRMLVTQLWVPEFRNPGTHIRAKQVWLPAYNLSTLKEKTEWPLDKLAKSESSEFREAHPKSVESDPES